MRIICSILMFIGVAAFFDNEPSSTDRTRRDWQARGAFIVACSAFALASFNRARLDKK